MNINPTNDPATDGQDAEYERLVTRFSESQTLSSTLERVKAEALRRRKAGELVTRARGGLLHNHTVREIARYFRTADRGPVELRQVTNHTGIPLGVAREVLREFVHAGLLHEHEEKDGESTRRFYQLASGAHDGMTAVFIETEAGARRHAEQDDAGWASGWLGWGSSR
ncbi:hypothetical protein ACIQK6_38585 [Streptomyces sp. NPDC091682]|uniref:hypothetical protein n=1 Tax=Streptomyces sp. NPDC091682 TaxID=3366005 RepID=UPI00380ED329